MLTARVAAVEWHGGCHSFISTAPVGWEPSKVSSLVAPPSL